MPQPKVKRTLPMSSVPIMHPAIFYDDATGTFNYIIDATAGNYVATYSTSAPFVGLKSIQLRTRTTDAAPNDYVTISKILWLPPEKLLRLQCIFTHLSSTLASYNTIYFTWLTGSRQHLAGIRTRPDSGEVWLASGFAGVEPTWTLHSNLRVPLLSPGLNKLDLSVDWNAGKHHILQLNDVSLDLRHLDTPQQDSVLASFLAFYIKVETLAASPASLFIDQLLLTPEAP